MRRRGGGRDGKKKRGGRKFKKKKTTLASPPGSPSRAFSLFTPPWNHVKEERVNCHGQSTPFFLKLLPNRVGGQIKRGRSLRSLNMIAESKQRGERIQEGASLQLASEDKKEIYSKNNLSLTPLPPNCVRIHQQTWHRQFYTTL